MKIGVYTFYDGKEPKDLKKENAQLKKQLAIAVDCLKEYANKDLWEGFEYTIKWDLRHACYVDGGYSEAEETLQQIKELEND